jgi:hypothetical protein
MSFLSGIFWYILLNTKRQTKLRNNSANNVNIWPPSPEIEYKEESEEEPVQEKKKQKERKEKKRKVEDDVEDFWKEANRIDIYAYYQPMGNGIAMKTKKMMMFMVHCHRHIFNNDMMTEDMVTSY